MTLLAKPMDAIATARLVLRPLRALLTHVFARIPDDTIYSGAFADNAASLRIQDKLGFTRDSEAMFFSRPNGKEMPHVATSVTRARFQP